MVLVADPRFGGAHAEEYSHQHKNTLNILLYSDDEGFFIGLIAITMEIFVEDKI